MSNSNLKTCRICHQLIDIVHLPEGESWIQPSTKYYYHTKCYNEWKQSNPTEDSAWIPRIYDFISRDLKMDYDYHMCEAQRKKMLKEKCTNKGIYFALKYFYEVKHGDKSKSYGGIGIVPYVYKESMEYWVKMEYKQSGFLADLEQQIIKKEQAQVIKIKSGATKKKNKDKWSLDDI